jgi:hypothetical protein
MEILLFDMDGVLVKPIAYHRALQETVRLAGIETGYGEARLSEDQITEFESRGISSEWHSSALCMAEMVLQVQHGKAGEDRNTQTRSLNLEDLFEAISAQPLHHSAVHRGQAAIETQAARYEVEPDLVNGMVVQSESIRHSPTLNWFQELILGSENFTRIYQKSPQFQTESYLKLYDERQLARSSAELVLKWAEVQDHGAAIMTNWPSLGPSGFSGMPDAELGSRIVGLAELPIIGKGEIVWLAAQTGLAGESFSKPSWKHAMAAILVASGWALEDSLNLISEPPEEWDIPTLSYLHDSTVAVFEDTSSGLIAAQEASELLDRMGVRVGVNKIGIAEEAAKQAALSALGAAVYPDVNQALAILDDF